MWTTSCRWRRTVPTCTRRWTTGSFFARYVWWWWRRWWWRWTMGSSFDVDGDDYHDTFMIVAKMHFCLSDHQPCRPRHHRRARDQQGEGGSDLSATWEPHTGQELRKVPKGKWWWWWRWFCLWMHKNMDYCQFSPSSVGIVVIGVDSHNIRSKDKKYINIVISWDNILKNNHYDKSTFWSDLSRRNAGWFLVWSGNWSGCTSSGRSTSTR